MSQPTGMNSSFGQPAPQLPPQQTGGVLGPMQPLVPQKTGPPPPVRFGTSGVKPLVAMRTGKADLGRASKCFFEFYEGCEGDVANRVCSAAKSIWVLKMIRGCPKKASFVNVWKGVQQKARGRNVRIRSEEDGTRNERRGCIYCVIDPAKCSLHTRLTCSLEKDNAYTHKVNGLQHQQVIETTLQFACTILHNFSPVHHVTYVNTVPANRVARIRPFRTSDRLRTSIVIRDCNNIAGRIRRLAAPHSRQNWHSLCITISPAHNTNTRPPILRLVGDERATAAHCWQ
jgi:hypothetical protein